MIISWFVLGLTLTAAFWLPGWLLARRWEISHAHVAGVLLSSLATYLLLMAAQVLEVALTRGVVLGGLCVWVLVSVVVARGRRAGADLSPPAVPLDAKRPSALRLVCLAIFAVATTILALRACRQPLTGWDTAYRWSWLAQQMLVEGNFDFYPPRSAADFRSYVYADGIPPLTHFAQFICFVGFGSAAPIAVAPLVIGQFLLLGYLAFLLGRDLGDENSGLLAMALAGLSPLLLWSVVMGQETGWTAIGIVAMVLYLQRLEPGDWRGALAGGAAAALAALAREYGCAMVILAVAWCCWRRLERRQIAIVCGCGLVAFTWYLRNWLLTGNPVFSNNLLGIFPDNPIHTAILAGYREYLSPFKHGWVWRESAVFLVRGALAPIAVGVLALLCLRRRYGLLTLAVLLMTLLWCYSMGVTAGGPRYALRVLSPVVILLAAVGGVWAARAPVAWLSAGLALLLVGVLPGLASVPFYVSSYSPDEIMRAADAPRNWDSPVAGALRRLIPERPAIVLTDNPFARRWLAGSGIDCVPVWSPEAAFIFDPEIDPQARSRELRKRGIRYVFKSNGGLNDAYLMTVPFFADELDDWPLIYRDAQNLLYRLPD